MSEKPILFNTEMVRAILDGRKTQTRRLIRPQPYGYLNYIMAGAPSSVVGKWGYDPDSRKRIQALEEAIDNLAGNEESNRLWLPPCHADDLLWVRETWNYGYVDSNYREYSPPDLWFEQEDPKHKETHYMASPSYWYYADAEDRKNMTELHGCWRPSIHMPKEAARIWLKVKRVCVERVQDITNRDATAEGVTCATDNSGMMHRHKFRELWDSISNEKSNWDANPWVWVISFERIERDLMRYADNDVMQGGLLPAT